MGEVEVLLPQETLDRAGRDRGSEARHQLSVTRPVDTTRETPGVEAANDGRRDEAAAVSDGEDSATGDMCNGDGPLAEAATRTKKKHRRGRSKKRKWKPYYKLSWQERKELEERESRRAHRIRDKMFAHGQAIAPYNTTQFLMEDHDVQEPDFRHIQQNGTHGRHNHAGSGMDSSDEFYSSPEDEEDFLQKQFSEVYEDIHAERLSAMSKNELVQEYIQLEERVEELESKLKEARTRLSSSTTDSEVQTPDGFEDQTWQKIEIFKEEIRKLTEENVRLRTHNEHLRSLVEYEDEEEEEEEDFEEEDEDEDEEEDDDEVVVASDIAVTTRS